MQFLCSALIAGIAAVALGASGAAFAQNAKSHVMTVELPGGGVAQVQFTGDVPPRVSVSEAPGVGFAAMPMRSPFGADSPFAMMDRISAEMDRQAAAMFREVDALMAQARPGQPLEAALGNLPAGAQSYSFVSTMSGSGVCSQSVEITSQGNGQPPRVVRHESGNCGPATATGGAVTVPTFTAPVKRPEIIETRAQQPKSNRAPADTADRPDVILTGTQGAKPYAGLVREIPPATR